ncbi:MAG: hypothetical protein V3W44_07235 [Dehalococcoidales bacterium]
MIAPVSLPAHHLEQLAVEAEVLRWAVPVLGLIVATAVLVRGSVTKREETKRVPLSRAGQCSLSKSIADK